MRKRKKLLDFPARLTFPLPTLTVNVTQANPGALAEYMHQTNLFLFLFLILAFRLNLFVKRWLGKQKRSLLD